MPGCPTAMRPGWSLSWTLLIVTGCATTPTTREPVVEPPTAPSTTPSVAPSVPPLTQSPSPPPAQADAAAMCAGIDAAAQELVRVRVEDAILECADGRLDRCQGETRYFVANCSDEPVDVRALKLLDPGGGRGMAMYEPADGHIAPRKVWAFKTRAYHEAAYRLKIDVVDIHDVPIFVAETPVRTSNPAREAAMTACKACNGVWGIQGLIYRDACNCQARDAGKECRDGDACEGACKFDHWEIASPAQPPGCTGKGKARVCSARVAAVGRPVGRCSERVAIRSCHKLLRPGIASEPDQPLPWGTSHMCID